MKLTMGVRATRMRITILETGIGSEEVTTIADALKSKTTLATLDVSLWVIIHRNDVTVRNACKRAPNGSRACHRH